MIELVSNLLSDKEFNGITIIKEEKSRLPSIPDIIKRECKRSYPSKQGEAWDAWRKLSERENYKTFKDLLTTYIQKEVIRAYDQSDEIQKARAAADKERHEKCAQDRQCGASR